MGAAHLLLLLHAAWGSFMGMHIAKAKQNDSALFLDTNVQFLQGKDTLFMLDQLVKHQS